MTVLTRPRHPLVDDALALARVWCEGHVIDGSPALGHAVKVARTLGRHLIRPHPELIAAALLHDAPFFIPDGLDLDLTLTSRFGPVVTQTIRALEREHEALDSQMTPAFIDADRWTLYAIAADKIVAINAIVNRARRATNPTEYWQSRTAFVSRVPYFRAFANHAARLLPPLMAAELNAVVTHAEHNIRLSPVDVNPM
jgi:(p)ppGpp synthase/HD superfamily hydrolase